MFSVDRGDFPINIISCCNLLGSYLTSYSIPIRLWLAAFNLLGILISLGEEYKPIKAKKHCGGTFEDLLIPRNISFRNKVIKEEKFLFTLY